MQTSNFAHSSLPIAAHQAELDLVATSSVGCVVEAPTGYGKTIGVPWFLTAFDSHPIYVILSKRLAAHSAAQYLKRHLGTDAVGVITGEFAQTHKNNRVTFLTAGVALRMLQAQNFDHRAVLIFDEFHERTTAMDLALAIALRQNETGTVRKLILMSASIDAGRLAEQFNFKLVSITGARSHPVTVEYHASKLGVKARLDTMLDFIRRSASSLGSAVVFLPGKPEVNAFYDALHSSCNCPVYRLTSDTPTADAQAIMTSEESHRIILATNIAESSVTISNLDTVLDSGITRFSKYHEAKDATQLVTEVASKASAIQRTGRVGRVKPGRVIRFWDKSADAQRPESEPAQIEISSIEDSILEAMLQNSTLTQLKLASYPAEARIQRTEVRLERLMLELLNKQDLGKLLATGLPIRQAMTLTLDYPRRDLWLRKFCALRLASEGRISRNLGNLESVDFDRLGPTFNRLLSQQINRINRIDLSEVELPHASLAEIWGDRLAIKQSSLRFNGFSTGYVAPEGLEHSMPDAVIVMQEHARKQDTHLTCWQPIELQEATNYIDSESVVERISAEYSPKSGKATRTLERTWGILVSTETEACSVDETLTLLKQYIADEWPLFDDEAFVSLLARLSWVTRGNNQLAFDAQRFMNSPDWLDMWFDSHLKDSPLSQRSIAYILEHSLPQAVSEALNRLAPKHYLLPTGRSVDLVYTHDRIMMRVIPQQLYGLQEHPVICGEAILIELLSPAKRPIQLTADIAAFWKGSYAEVRKEMKGRYPKHYWPEQPETAAPSDKSVKPR